MTSRREYTWWLVGDSHTGAEMVLASTAAEARQNRRGTFITAYEAAGGLSHSAAIRAASSSHVHVIAGGLTEQEAWQILRHWQDGNVGPARNAGRAYRRDPHWTPPYPPPIKGKHPQ
jgi:hypothetical protein